MRKLLKTVQTIDDFDLELFEKLNIGVEIQDYTEPNLTFEEMEDTMNRYKEKLKDFTGIVSMHGPFLDLKPASPDWRIREMSQQRYLNFLYIARELEADYVIFHSQINPGLNKPLIKDYNNTQGKEALEDIIKRSGYKGEVLLENIFEPEPEILKEFLDEISNEKINVNLDLGHAKLGKVELEEWFIVLNGYIRYVHVHSNDGLYDNHDIPKTYELENLFKYIEKHKIDAVLSLEYNVKDLEKEIKRYNELNDRYNIL